MANKRESLAVNNEDEVKEVPKEKQPKRILHFCDGTLEEYSTDEEEEPDSSKTLVTVDPTTLKWAPWFWYQTIYAGTKVLHVCDYLGESLATFFGILTPKYQSEIDHFEQMKAEEEEQEKKEDLEMGGWKNRLNSEVIQSEVKHDDDVLVDGRY